MQPIAIIERLFTLLLYILRGTQTYSIRSTAIITVIHVETCGENIPKKSIGLQIQSCLLRKSYPEANKAYSFPTTNKINKSLSAKLHMYVLQFVVLLVLPYFHINIEMILPIEPRIIMVTKITTNVIVY
jgi:hypothetical protein